MMDTMNSNSRPSSNPSNTPHDPPLLASRERWENKMNNSIATSRADVDTGSSDSSPNSLQHRCTLRSNGKSLRSRNRHRGKSTHGRGRVATANSHSTKNRGTRLVRLDPRKPCVYTSKLLAYIPVGPPQSRSYTHVLRATTTAKKLAKNLNQPPVAMTALTPLL